MRLFAIISFVKLIDMKIKSFCSMFFLLAIFVSCHEKNLPMPNTEEKIESTPIAVLSEKEVQAQKMIASMSDSELAAQVLMTGIDGDEHLAPGMAELLQEIPAGAVMLFRYNLTGDTGSIKNLLNETALYIEESGNDIPPFIAVDHEGGLVHRFSDGMTRLPAARSYWERSQTENWDVVLVAINTEVLSSAKELAALGINMNLAPLAEIENDENVLFLDTRSYGPNAEFTAAAVSAFADAMIQAGIIPVLKHFPGSSNVDPHSGVAVMEQSRDELDAMIMPFKQAIQNGNARAVMISHSIVPTIDPDKNGSLSSIVIQDWLRGELGFEGIIIADDFSMSAVTSRGINTEEAVIKALNAGVNLVMVWPKELRKTHTAILSALDDGRLSRETLLSRVENILLEKIILGVIQNETIN
jgi:beta-N-acetylhexosaminidase